MITAKNYAAQAEKDLSNNFVTKCFSEDAEAVKNYFIDPIKDCVHFAIPDDGIVFDDGKKGIRNTKVRLPFPKITVEYYFHKTELDTTTKLWASKHLILAQEIKVKDIKNYADSQQYFLGRYLDYDDDDIMISVLASTYIPKVGFWLVDPVGWLMPSEWDRDIDWNIDKNSKTFVGGFPLPILRKELEYAIETYGEDAKTEAFQEIGSEVNALLEFCEALSCSNVKHEIMEKTDPAVNQKRIRGGKVPMYETRTLWIDVPGGSKDSGDWQGGTHRSPRQHLRRGHIRRLPTGKKVWVNAAVVGAKENGIIKKDYAIKELV